MSIENEITRIMTAKEELKTAINAKGGTLAGETLDHYSAAVYALENTDTSDATAIPSDILSGKTAYTAAGKITGTLKMSVDFYRCTSVTNKENIYYFSEINGETVELFYMGKEELTKIIESHKATDQDGDNIYESIIVSTPGVCIAFDVYKTAEDVRYLAPLYDVDYGPESGISSLDVNMLYPDQRSYAISRHSPVNGDPVSVEYDRCIEAVSFLPEKEIEIIKNWSGQKAVLTDGVYSFEETVTEGLPFTSVIPVVGKTYSADALVLVGSLYSGLPTADLSYYLPLNSATLSTTTGQTVVPYSGTVQSTTYKGIDCVQFDGSTVLKSTVENVSMAESPLTVSFWVASSADSVYIMAWGDPSTGNSSWGKRTAIYGSTGIITLSGHGAGYGWDSVEPAPFTWDGTWNHVCFTFGEANSSSRNAMCYVNGSLVREGAFRYYSFTDNPEMYIGSYWQSDMPLIGYMAALRFYNRVLTQEEIQTLASEFKPTA